MTMRITMLQARLGEAGAVLAAGSTNTVSDAFGALMVGQGYATDTDGALTPPASTPNVVAHGGQLFQVGVSTDGTGLVGDITNAQATSGSLVGAAPGEVRALSDTPNTGVLVRWAMPEGSQAYAWCWHIYPLSKYEG